MSEISRLLRLLVQGDKELKVTNQAVPDYATKFTSNLSEGYKRKHFRIFNRTHDKSGEIFLGTEHLSYSGENYVIPSGEELTIPISTDVDIYFCASSGEVGDLRIMEIA